MTNASILDSLQTMRYSGTGGKMIKGSFGDQFRKASIGGQGAPRRDQEIRDPLPVGYLANGYFSEKGYLHEELVTSMAKEVARCLGRGIKSHQIRRFYNVVKGAETRLEYTEDWDSINVEVKGLLAFASEAEPSKKFRRRF